MAIQTTFTVSTGARRGSRGADTRVDKTKISRALMLIMLLRAKGRVAAILAQGQCTEDVEGPATEPHRSVIARRSSRRVTGGGITKEETMKHFATALLAFGVMFAALPAARAADTTCPPNPPANSIVNGNLVVPSGQCQLSGVTVTGNVQVQKNAVLVTVGTTIDGNVSIGAGASFGPQTTKIDGNVGADQCNSIEISSVTIGGNLSIQDCTGDAIGYGDAEIAGNFTCDNNSGLCFADGGNVKSNVQMNNNFNADAANNTIGGNMQVNDNGAASSVSGNTVNGNLKCQGNASPFSASGNIVHGNTQCP